MPVSMLGMSARTGTSAERNFEMSCINADGTLTKTAEKVMSAMGTPSKDAEIAARISFPVFLVRSSLRQLVELGLVSESGGQYALTELGRQKLRA